MITTGAAPATDVKTPLSTLIACDMGEEARFSDKHSFHALPEEIRLSTAHAGLSGGAARTYRSATVRSDVRVPQLPASGPGHSPRALSRRGECPERSESRPS